MKIFILFSYVRAVPCAHIIFEPDHSVARRYIKQFKSERKKKKLHTRCLDVYLIIFGWCVMIFGSNYSYRRFKCCAAVSVAVASRGSGAL